MGRQRKIILKIALWALGCAAASGVLAVLLDKNDLMFRVMASTITMAACAGVILPLTMMLEQTRTRAGGLFGIVGTVFEFLLILALIWLSDLPGYANHEEEFGFSALVFAGSGSSVIGMLVLARTEGTRLAAWFGIAGAAGFTILMWVALWLPDLTRWGWQEQEHGFITGWWLAYGGFVSMGTLVGFARPKDSTSWRWVLKDRRAWRWLGIAVMLVALPCYITDAWHSGSINERGYSAGVTLSLLVCYCNLLLFIPAKSGARWATYASVAAATFTVVMINMLVFTDFDWYEDLLVRLVSAGAIVTGCGTLAVAVLQALSRRFGEITHETAQMITVSMTCPRCALIQEINVGKDTCKACGLRIRLSIDDPRCPACGYLLHRHQTDNCPECGRPIRNNPAGDG